jgi:hypothetical protein
MSVKVRYAGDKDIIVGQSGGSALFTPVSIGFPAYGTLINTLYLYEYPSSQGGSTVDVGGTFYPSQTVTLDELADGAGGTFFDWSNERDIAYKVYGSYISTYSYTTYVDINGTGYPNGSASYDFVHDGYGQYTTNNNNGSYYGYGSYITYDAVNHNGGSIEVPSGSGNYYNNANYNGYDYFHDGNGGYYVSDAGFNGYFIYGYSYTSVASTIEVPIYSGNYYGNGLSTDYYADGYGGYQSSTSGSVHAYGAVTYVSNPNNTEVPSGSGSNYPNGTTTDYVSDGTGYYYQTINGSFLSYGTFIRNYIYYPTGNSVEVPSGSGNYFYDQWFGDKYYWDGSGFYYASTTTSYYDYGTYITSDGTYDYYWDGYGGTFFYLTP